MTRFSAELFRICLPFVAGQEERRTYLRGVAVQPRQAGGAYLVATDGHRMLVVHDERGEVAEPIIVPWSGATKPLKATRSTERRTIRISEGGTLNIESQETSYSGTPGRSVLTAPKSVYIAPGFLIEGLYFDWRRILLTGPFDRPRSEDLDGLYLADFGLAGADLSLARGDRRRPNAAMRLLHGAHGGPVLIRWPDVDFAVGMQMPRRDGSSMSALPAFLDDSAEAA